MPSGALHFGCHSYGLTQPPTLMPVSTKAPSRALRLPNHEGEMKALSGAPLRPPISCQVPLRQIRASGLIARTNSMSLSLRRKPMQPRLPSRTRNVRLTKPLASMMAAPCLSSSGRNWTLDRAAGGAISQSRS